MITAAGPAHHVCRGCPALLGD